MVIRLGRYAREMGIKQEVDWAKKQDLLAEVAYRMVQEDCEDLAWGVFVDEFNVIFSRLGEALRGEIVMNELVESGVLVETSARFGFHWLAFRDFFAAQHLFRRHPQTLEQFFLDHMLDRKWGTVLVFAAGLRRHNTQLLQRLNAAIEELRRNAVGCPGDDYLYGSYLLGRILANSDAAEAGARTETLRTCLQASRISIGEYTQIAKEQLGNVGEIAALLGVEQTFFVTVGVPWLSQQFRELAEDPALSEEERFLAASVYAQLNCENFLEVVDQAIAEARTTKIILVFSVLSHYLRSERKLSQEECELLDRVELRLDRKLNDRKKEVDRLLSVRSKALELEIQRMRRLGGSN